VVITKGEVLENYWSKKKSIPIRNFYGDRGNRGDTRIMLDIYALIKQLIIGDKYKEKCFFRGI
jgi:hypothetical protein